MRLGNAGLAVDSAAEINGRWVDGPEEWGGVSLLICGVESPGYRAAARERKLDRLTPDQRDVALANLASSSPSTHSALPRSVWKESANAIDM